MRCVLREAGEDTRPQERSEKTMNAMCEACRHYWRDTTARHDVAKLFDSARLRLAGDRRALSVLKGLEEDCKDLSERHLCIYDGIEPVLEEGDEECGWWEAA